MLDIIASPGRSNTGTDRNKKSSDDGEEAGEDAEETLNPTPSSSIAEETAGDRTKCRA